MTQIIRSSVDTEVKRRFIDYASYVVVDRALPDIRDGLKPVQRRILTSMYDLGLYFNRSYKKSARAVGDTLGRYHPHGDTSIYDALIVMSQEWKTRYPLIDVHGNGGSIDGDPAAAMRYTETRMTRVGNSMIDGIDRTLVDYAPTFDDSDMEPTVLNTMIPAMLLNGTTGIAVGMATSVPPHHAGSIYAAIDYAIEQAMNGSDSDIEELIRIVGTPDFPTGGIITNTEEIVRGYRTGRGKVIVRGKYEIVTDKKNTRIHITEMPYQVNKAKLVAKIDDLRKEQLKDEIKAVRDESARGEILVVVELKKDANPDFVLKRLLKHTDLQTSVSMNMIALRDGRPILFTLKDAIDAFLAHVADIITRRTQRDLTKAMARLHIVEGLLIAGERLKETVQSIQDTEKDEDVVPNLQTFLGISEIQAKAISDMRLRRLSEESFKKYKEEKEQLDADITRFNDILDDTNVLLSVMRVELAEKALMLKDERRTVVQVEDAQIADRELIKEEDLIVTITQNGMIKSVPADAYEAKGRGTKGVKSAVKDEDAIAHMFSVNSRDDLLFFTNTGRCHLLEVYKLPVMNKGQNGKYVANYLNLDAASDEYIVSVIPKEYENNEQDILMATGNGTIKRLALASLSTRMRQTRVITFKENDYLVAVQLMAPGQDVVLLTANGQGLRINPDAENNGVRPMGRTASGVIGIRLKDNDFVIAMTVVDDAKDLMLVSEKGYGKRVSFENIPAKGRAGQGVIMMGLSEKTGLLSCVTIIDDEHDLMIATLNGIMSRIHADTIRAMGRSAAGVKVINLKEEDEVISISEQEREAEEDEPSETN